MNTQSIHVWRMRNGDFFEVKLGTIDRYPEKTVSMHLHFLNRKNNIFLYQSLTVGIKDWLNLHTQHAYINTCICTLSSGLSSEYLSYSHIQQFIASWKSLK